MNLPQEASSIFFLGAYAEGLESTFTSEHTVQDRLGFINMPLEASLSFIDVPRAIYLGEQLKPKVFFSLVSYFDQVTQEIKKQEKKPS